MYHVITSAGIIIINIFTHSIPSTWLPLQMVSSITAPLLITWWLRYRVDTASTYCEIKYSYVQRQWLCNHAPITVDSWYIAAQCNIMLHTAHQSETERLNWPNTPIISFSLYMVFSTSDIYLVLSQFFLTFITDYSLWAATPRNWELAILPTCNWYHCHAQLPSDVNSPTPDAFHRYVWKFTPWLSACKWWTHFNIP